MSRLYVRAPAGAFAATALLWLVLAPATAVHGADTAATSGRPAPAQEAVPPAGSIERVPTPPATVPAGTALQVELSANVATKTARVGDRVEGRLARDLVVGERRAALAGATISGTVTEVVPGNDALGTRPALALAFDSLQAANGATVPIVALYRHDADADPAERAILQATGEVRLRAGSVITATTETIFSIY